MPTPDRTLLPELVWNGTTFLRGAAVVLEEDGTLSVGRAEGVAGGVALKRRALLPGFVNAHSHAFQRGLRSQPQRFGSGAGNFWTWRDTMYALAESLTPDTFYSTSLLCFREMLRAGMTTVGEFHYLHHASDRCDDWAFDTAILSAARDAGIRMVLIQTWYETGNIGRPLEGAQKRFGPVSRDEFVRQFEALAGMIDSATQSLAIACHSIRACSIEDLKHFHDVARSSKAPFHIHVEEARKEIDDCVAAHGKTPMRVLLDELAIDDRVTAIHCTHTSPDDLREYVARGGRVCLCPLTEGNLSDGFCDVPTTRQSDGKLCFGTDSNIRISATEELRWMEFAQRLCREKRGVITGSDGHNAAKLIEIGTVGGAESLGVPAGMIASGQLADLVSVNLDHPSMQGCDESSVLDSLVFGSGNGPIDQVWVGGKAVRP